MQRTAPPPFFRQGISALARLTIFSLLAIALLITDARTGLLVMLRQGVGTLLSPVQRMLLTPRDVLATISQHVAEVDRLRSENLELRGVEIANARTLLEAQQLRHENTRLRELLVARDRVVTPSVTAEMLYETRDPATRRAVIDRGQQHGVMAGQPVIDATGLVGQVTRVTPSTAEVTLIIDRQAIIPVEVQRTGQRLLAFGGGPHGLLELRFLSAGSDLVGGDRLVTSGLDGVYPPGLPVADVLAPPDASQSSAPVQARPLAGVDRSRLLLVLLVEPRVIVSPAAPPTPEPRRRRAARETAP